MDGTYREKRIPSFDCALTITPPLSAGLGNELAVGDAGLKT